MQCVCFTSLSQNRNIDSLYNCLKLDKQDTSKLIHLNKLSREFLNIGLFDSALYYSNKVLEFNESKLISLEGEFRKRINKSKADAFNNLGIVYAQQGQFPKALEVWLKSLKIHEKLNNKSGIASINGNIGNIYWSLKDFKKALFYYFKALKLSQELNNIELIAKWYGNIGNVYRDQIYNEKIIINEKELLLSKSLDYYFKALKIHESSNNRLGIALMKGNIAIVYLDLATISLNNSNVRDSLFELAEENIFISLKINHETGNNFDEAIQLGNLGQLYYLLNKNKLAEEYFLKALVKFKDLEAVEYLRNFEQKISYFYYSNKDYKAAYEHYVEFKNLNDSIYNTEKSKELVQKEMNFEFEKKEALTKAEHEKKEALDKVEKRKQVIIIYSVLSGLLIVIVFSVFLLRLFIQKRKANLLLAQQNNEIRQQKEEISAQRDEISAQRDLVTNQKEHIEEIHKEVTDSINYAKRLQNAILPTVKFWQKNFPNSFVLFKPKDIVSGDFYWATKIDNSLIIFAAADCTGHGVPGAMVSVVCSNALNRVVNEFKIIEPGEILDKTKELVVEHFTKGGEDVKDGMDISLCSLINEKEKIILKWAGANNPLWIIRDNGIIEYKPNKQPVGKTDIVVPYTTYNIELIKNDVFYIFSDGYQDQFGGELGKKFKASKTKELLLSIQSKSMIEQKEILSDNFNGWKGKLEQVDDICFIGVKV